MPSLKKIADDLLITVSLNSDDAKVDRRSLYYNIGTKRAFLVRQEIERKARIDETYVQTIPCMPLILVDRNTSSCCNNLPTGCTILRTIDKVPTTIPVLGRRGIISISSPDLLGMDIPLVDLFDFKTIGSGRHNSKIPYATILEDYIYIRTKKNIFQNIAGSTVKVRLVMEEPLDLQNYPNCEAEEGTVCFSEEEEYPISSHLLPAIKQMVLKEDLQIILSTPEDNNNNASSE